jgi:hypothetical protein
MPTLPRALPVPVPPRPAPAMQPAQVPHFQAPIRQGSQAKRKSFIQTWTVVLAIVLTAAVAGVIVAMSGPDVTVQHGK